MTARSCLYKWLHTLHLSATVEVRLLYVKKNKKATSRHPLHLLHDHAEHPIAVSSKGMPQHLCTPSIILYIIILRPLISCLIQCLGILSLPILFPACVMWSHPEGHPLIPSLMHSLRAFYLLTSRHITRAAASCLRQVQLRCRAS